MILTPLLQTHQLISPRLYHGRTKREVGSSLEEGEEGGHAHHLTVAWVDKEGKEAVLDLQLNRDLIPEAYTQRYHHQVTRKEPIRGALTRLGSLA